MLFGFLTLASVVAGSPAAIAVDTTWTFNGDGNWNVGTNWNNGVPTNSTFNVFIDDGDSAVTVNMNVNTAISTLTIGANDKLSFVDTFDLSITGGSVVNDGIIALNAAGVVNQNTDINFTAAVTTLSGSGTLLLGGAFENRVTNSSITNELVNSATHTIAGGGQLGFNGMKLTNQGLVDANIAGKTLFVDPSASNAVNTGTMQASSGGVLRLQGGVFTNTAGTIRALDTGVVEFFGGGGAAGTQIVGGTLSTAGSGVIRMVGGDGGTLLENVTLAAGSTLQYGANLDSTIKGTFTNNGSVEQPSLTPGTMQLLIDGDTTLGGTGSWTMSGNGNSLMRSVTGSATVLTNDTQHTIRGTGDIGNAFLNINNKGKIVADQAGMLLLLNPTSGLSGGSVTNSGTLRAENGATLRLQSGPLFSTGGHIEAADGSTVLLNDLGSFDGDTFTTTGNGVVQFNSIANMTGNVLKDVTINGLVRIANNVDPVLRGTITNNGTLEQNSTGSTTEAQIDANTTVTGSGQWVLSDNVNNRIRRSGADPSLLLTNDTPHTIRGAGNIGFDQIGIVNKGVINADQATALTIDPSTANVVNQATGVLRGSGSAGLQLTGGSFDNQGTVEALNSSNVTYSATATTANNVAGVLTGGKWRAVAAGGGATLTLRGPSITEIASGTEVVLSGAGSVLQAVATPIETTLVTNRGTLRVLDNRGYTAVPAGALVNSGTIQLGGGTFASTLLTNSGEIFGFGTLAPRPTNSGTIRAAGGTLIAPLGIQGGSGTVQIDAGATLNLGAAALGSSADMLIHNGSSLNLGANSFLVAVDYQNGSFGVGNAFNARANVAGSGQINASPGISQTLGGSVTNGGTATATMAFGNVHVGDAPTLNYQINNGGASGPKLRGAIQTSVGGANLTDPRLGGAGVTASNFGPIAVGGNSGNLGVTFNATTAGPLANQKVRIVNNFDNVAEQTLEISGAAYRYASPSAHTPEPVSFGNRHVGDSVTQALAITNNVPADGFSESLNASLGSATGGVTTSGSFTALAPGSSNNSSLVVGIDTATAGVKNGTASIALTSNGTGSSGLGNTALAAQTVNVTGTVYRLAAPSAHSPEPVNFGIVHVGDIVSGPISIGNTAAADGFSERLNASIGSATGNATTNGGAISGLLPNSSNNTSLSVGVTTTTAGAKSGTATISLVSTGTGTSGLANTNLTSQTVNVSAQVNNFAVASMAKVAGDGNFTMNGANEFTLNLGFVAKEATDLLAELEVANTAAAPADSLAGSFTLAAPGFALSGFGAFSNVAAGASHGGLMVGLDSATVGDFTGTITVQPQSTNPQPFSMNLAPITIHLVGEVRLAGDYNDDGTVDAADFTVWRDKLGTAGPLANETVSVGTVDSLDYNAWKSNFGAVAGAGSGASDWNAVSASTGTVPEPASLSLVLVGAVALTNRRGRRALGKLCETP